MVWTIGATPPGYDPRTVQRVQRPKAPSDTTTFAADFGGALTSAVDGDTIAAVTSVTVQRNDGGSDTFSSVVPPQISSDGRRVILWLTGGLPGCEYLISITINSVAGQTLTRSFIIPVLGR